MEIDKHKKSFGDQAENYTKYRMPYQQELFAFLATRIPSGSTKILDIACGTGKSTEPLTSLGLEVYGCDHDALMVEEAQKQSVTKGLSIRYSVADVEHLPFENDTFDVVTVGTAFHWFVNEQSITEIKRVLKNNGLLFIYWTLSKEDTPEEDEIPSDIFRTYNWDRVPPQLRDAKHISEFLSSHGLQDVQRSMIPFSYTASVEERVGLQKTASAYGLLSEENKTNFLNEVRNALTAQLGNRKAFTLKEEIHVCYGYKKI